MFVDPATPLVEVVSTTLIGDAPKGSDLDFAVLGNVDVTDLTGVGILYRRRM